MHLPRALPLAAAMFLLAACHGRDVAGAAPQEEAGEALPATTIVMGFPPTAAPQFDAKRCATARKAIDDFVSKLPASCDKDEDCGGFYLHDDVCSGPTMLHEPGCPAGLKPRLFALQHMQRMSCEPGPVCSPRPYRAVCVSHRCADALADAGAASTAPRKRADAGR